MRSAAKLTTTPTRTDTLIGQRHFDCRYLVISCALLLVAGGLLDQSMGLSQMRRAMAARDRAQHDLRPRPAPVLPYLDTASARTGREARRRQARARAEASRTLPWPLLRAPTCTSAAPCVDASGEDAGGLRRRWEATGPDDGRPPRRRRQRAAREGAGPLGDGGASNAAKGLGSSAASTTAGASAAAGTPTAVVQRERKREAAAEEAAAAAAAARPAEVFVVTFSDRRANPHLHTLASTVQHFSARPLHVLGLSGARAPDAARAGRWGALERRAIRGTDPGKLKKVWFLGALLSRAAPLGMRPHDLLLFVARRGRQKRPRPAPRKPPAVSAWAPLESVGRGRAVGGHARSSGHGRAPGRTPSGARWPSPPPWALRGGCAPRGRGAAQVDAFDVLVQRPLGALPAAYDLLRAAHGMPEDATFALGELNCWPWPRAEWRGKRRPRGVSMDYMANASFPVRGGAPGAVELLPADGVCAALQRRARPGTWLYPNAGALLSTLRGARALLEQMRGLIAQGHFEDQAMLGLALLQQPNGSIRVDSNASLFSSQYAYDAKRWARPACFADYFDAHGAPPPQRGGGGGAPFAMHFNGPAGRYRLGWCTAVMQRRAAAAGQYMIDLDAAEDGARVPLPSYCGGVLATSTARKRTAAPPQPVPPPLPCNEPNQTRLGCTNDHCFVDG